MHRQGNFPVPENRDRPSTNIVELNRSIKDVENIESKIFEKFCADKVKYQCLFPTELEEGILEKKNKDFTLKKIDSCAIFLIRNRYE